MSTQEIIQLMRLMNIAQIRAELDAMTAEERQVFALVFKRAAKRKP